jgi:predicted Zn finger-like uncharacterized protein
MVVKCFYCESLLHVDENRIPGDQDVRVRCPKCGKEGLIQKEENPLGSITDNSPVIELGGPSLIQQSAVTEKKMDQSSSRRSASGKAGELTLPEDAFKNFRFPAETGAPNQKRSFWSSRSKLIAFVVVSVLVVIFFAALVNIILPGLPPAGVEQVTSSDASAH